MCGIVGVLAFGPADPASAVERIDAMLPALGHRGPDDRGRWHAATATGGTVALGHTRLAIIDLSNDGRQPMVRNHVTVSYNGEITNFRTLRDRLRDAGSTFTSSSDTEVLVRAYERWGAAAVAQIDGMFAFALWDALRGRLVLARDRFGVKPLYYHRGPQHLVFGSEIRALLASGLVRPTLDPASLWHYCGYQTAPTPATLLRDVRMLEPGHVTEVRADGRTSTTRYWSLFDRPAASSAPTTSAPVTTHVGELLREAVASHMVSDVPVGVFLSGGVDSGAIVSTLHAIGIRPRTFTVGLDDDADADESAAAWLTAETFGCDHEEVRVRGTDVVAMLPQVLGAVDHPSGDGINTFIVAQAVRGRGLKVALSGLGGDEVFGGYPSFRRLSRLVSAGGRWGRSSRGLRRAAASVVRLAGAGRVTTEKAAAALETDGTLGDMWPLTRQLFSTSRRRALLAPRLQPPPDAPDAWAALLGHAFEEAQGAGQWAKISYAEMRCYMHDVLLRDTDQMSMAHGLEVRVPLLDHRLASYIASLPDPRGAGGSQPKALLVNSLVHRLPPAVARHTKRGFTLPFDAWMRRPLRAFCEAQLGSQGLEGRGVLAPRAGARIWSGFLRRERGITAGRVWPLVALNAWMERNEVRVP